MLARAVPTCPALPLQHTTACTVTVLFVRITSQPTPNLHALTVLPFQCSRTVATIPWATTYLHLSCAFLLPA